jgi:hypothetical protein
MLWNPDSAVGSKLNATPFVILVTYTYSVTFFLSEVDIGEMNTWIEQADPDMSDLPSDLISRSTKNSIIKNKQ